MRRIKVKDLSMDAFRNYGYFANMLKPDSYGFGEAPIQFFRDILQLYVGADVSSFSICQVAKRPFIIDKTEFHSSCGEGILPLDGDILLHCGPATRKGFIPLEQFEVFRVPKGTMVVLKPGVWHHAPFALTDQSVHILIVLPERTYANDCTVIELKPDEKIEIEI